MTPIEDEHPTRDLPPGIELNILVAEDDPNTRMILTKQLGGKARLRLAADGVEAWRQYLADPPDILLSDWMMPNMSGLELCRRVKASRVFCYVILMTARDALDDKVNALECGADEYLVKLTSTWSNRCITGSYGLASRPLLGFWISIDPWPMRVARMP